MWPAYNDVGEFHAATTFVGSCLARTRITLGLLVDDDKAIALYDDDGTPEDGINPGLADTCQRVLATLRPPVGGQARLLEPAGKNMAGPGEFWLIGNEQTSTDAAGATVVMSRTFEVCSSSEIVRGSKTYTDPVTGVRRQTWARVYAPHTTPVELAPETFLWRTHRPHPEYSAVADSPVRALLPVLERMRLLTLHGKSEAMSRLAGAGVLLIPEGMSFPDDDTADGATQFQKRLIAALSTSVKDPASASAFTPYVVEMKGDAIGQVAHLRFDRPDFDADGKRGKAVEEFARGIDLPPEQVTGLGKSTHWNASTIDEATYKAFIMPVADLILESWTAGFLRPQVTAAYGATWTTTLAAQLERIVLIPDASALLVHPDREKAADIGYGTATAPNFGVSAKTWRRVHGWGEGDGPDQAEIDERVRLAELLRMRLSVQAPGDAPAPLPDGTGLPPVPDNAPAGGPPDAVTAATVDALVLLAAERAADRVAAKCRDRARAAGHGPALNGVTARDTVPVLAAAGVRWQVEPADLPPGEFARLADVVRDLAGGVVADRAVDDARVLAWRLATPAG